MPPVTRRQLLRDGAAAVVCLTVLPACDDRGGRPTTAPADPIADAGTVDDYPADGVYPGRAARAAGGFFVVRRGNRLFAVSSACTHLGCTVASEAGELRCPCHGSRFATDGRRLSGPAKGPLPRLAIGTDPDTDRLRVDPSIKLAPDPSRDPAAYVLIP